MFVKNSSNDPLVRVAKTKNLVFESGERGCIMIGADGMPLYLPNLFLTTQIRNQSRSASTVTNSAVHLCAFLQAVGEGRIDLVARMVEGRVMEPFEVEALRGDLQRRLVDDPRGTGSLSFFSPNEFISKDVVHARVGIGIRYLKWLATYHLRKPVDPDELQRIVDVLEQLRPIDKKRNRLKRMRGLNDLAAAAVKELMRPGSNLNIWEDRAIQVRNRLAIALMFELGIRRGELLNLKIEDFDFSANQVAIMRRADEKSDSRVLQPLVKTNDRIVPAKQSLMNEVRLYISEHRRRTNGAKKHGFLLVTHKAGPSEGQPLSIVSYQAVIRSIKDSVPPLKDFSGHDLRHYWNERFSDLMDASGVSAAEEEQMRSELMGWKFGSGSAKHYIHRFVQRKAAEYGLKMQEESLRSWKVLK